MRMVFGTSATKTGVDVSIVLAIKFQSGVAAANLSKRAIPTVQSRRYVITAAESPRMKPIKELASESGSPEKIGVGPVPEKSSTFRSLWTTITKMTEPKSSPTPFDSLLDQIRLIVREEITAAHTSGSSKTTETDAMLTVDEAATLMGVNRRWIYRHAHRLPRGIPS